MRRVCIVVVVEIKVKSAVEDMSGCAGYLVLLYKGIPCFGIACLDLRAVRCVPCVACHAPCVAEMVEFFGPNNGLKSQQILSQDSEEVR